MSTGINTYLLSRFFVGFVSQGVTTDRLGGNRYVNFVVGTVLEVPALLLSIYVSERYRQT